MHIRSPKNFETSQEYLGDSCFYCPVTYATCPPPIQPKVKDMSLFFRLSQVDATQSQCTQKTECHYRFQFSRTIAVYMPKRRVCDVSAVFFIFGIPRCKKNKELQFIVKIYFCWKSYRLTIIRDKLASGLNRKFLTRFKVVSPKLTFFLSHTQQSHYIKICYSTSGN